MRILFTAAILTLASQATAFETCQVDYRNYQTEIGKDVWLIRRDSVSNVKNSAESKALTVDALKQTGPESWSPDDAKSRNYGEKVQILAGLVPISPNDSTPQYFRVRSKSGEEFVVKARDTWVFDFRQCKPSDLLKQRTNKFGEEFQFFDAVPVRPRHDARPLDFSGDWIEQKVLADLDFVVCDKYTTSLKTNKPVLQCSAFYKSAPKGDKPLSLYFESDDDLEAITLD